MFKRHEWSWAALLFLIGTSALAAHESLQVSPATNPVSVDSQHEILPQSFLSNLDGMNLVDKYGRPFQPTALVNHVVLFNFIFTGCSSVCPLQTRILAQVFAELPVDVRSQVRFVSVSIDPDNDTPDKLRQFSKTMNADFDGWSFLTGDARQIEGLTQRLRIFDEPGSGQANKSKIHRASLWLVDQQGRMLQRYRGDPPDKERLIRELTQVSSMTSLTAKP